MYRNRLSLTSLDGISTAFAITNRSGWTQEVSRSAVYKAHEFLKTPKRGKQINDLMHFGATYDGHEYLRTVFVKDAAGNLIPGEFVIVYRFYWNGQFSTDLAVFCTAAGDIESVKSLRSDGVGNAPFQLGQPAVTIVGNSVYDSMKDQMSDRDKWAFWKLVNDADVEALLEMQLKLQQSLGL